MYRIYEETERKTGKRRVIAVSTYAGKTVKGIATCAPEDEYSYEKGVELAMARCNAKVATKRCKNARKKYNEAYEEFKKAERRLMKMEDYVTDAIAEEDKTYEILRRFEEAIGK